MTSLWRAGLSACVVLLAGTVAAAADFPPPVEGDFVTRDFKFATGETLPELKIHYRTIGTPQRDTAGVIRNAVLLLHSTGNTGAAFLLPTFGGLLFGPGQPLDATRYFLILPDAIGHGKSSKPSDGLRARFPKYTYGDMVRAQHLLVTEGLKVSHVRLMLGASMGGMQCWMWGETYPEFADGLVALATVPAQIAGRSRVMRVMLMDAIRNDPAWKGGAYTEEPRVGLANAINYLMIMTSSPLQYMKENPTRDAADAWYAKEIAARLATADANDMLYQFDSSRDYDPTAKLDTITAPLLAINSADDLVNPPELGIMERLIARVEHGRFILVPTSGDTWGHPTHSRPLVWGKYVAEFLQTLPERSAAPGKPGQQ
jgi:homoserine O-acetyltransferase